MDFPAGTVVKHTGDGVDLELVVGGWRRDRVNGKEEVLVMIDVDSVHRQYLRASGNSFAHVHKVLRLTEHRSVVVYVQNLHTNLLSHKRLSTVISWNIISLYFSPSGVARLERARVQGLQKAPSSRHRVRLVLPQRWVRVNCTPCTPYCYATAPTHYVNNQISHSIDIQQVF